MFSVAREEYSEFTALGDEPATNISQPTGLRSQRTVLTRTRTGNLQRHRRISHTAENRPVRRRAFARSLAGRTNINNLRHDFGGINSGEADRGKACLAPPAPKPGARRLSTGEAIDSDPARGID
jgi:hypothetical protein